MRQSYWIKSSSWHDVKAKARKEKMTTEKTKTKPVEEKRGRIYKRAAEFLKADYTLKTLTDEIGENEIVIHSLTPTTYKGQDAFEADIEIDGERKTLSILSAPVVSQLKKIEKYLPLLAGFKSVKGGSHGEYWSIVTD